MAPPRTQAFLEELRDTQIIPATQLTQVQQHPLARGNDPMPLVRELVKKGLLTSYQADRLLQGRGRELVLGSYRLLDLLGEGGMGQVFRASHLTMDRIVAVKVIRKDKVSNPTAVQRFYQEVRAAAQLIHPNIVTSFDAGQAGDTLFLVMEYVEGTDLARLVKQSGPLPVAEACEYIRQAACGLAHAHERGLVHRDIKPHNLLLARVGKSAVIKILDMGLARLQGPVDEPDKNLTRVGAIIGTPEYLAPEQAVNSHNVDIRADLYSLGCTFYFLLTGRPPFRGESVNDVLFKHQTQEPPPLSQFRNDVPPPVEALVRKLLAKKPADRLQTPDELAEALGTIVRKKAAAPSAVTNGASITSTPNVWANLGTDAPQRRSRARRVLVLGAMALLALTGLVLAAAFLSGDSQAKPTGTQAVRATVTTAPSRQTAPPPTSTGSATSRPVEKPRPFVLPPLSPTDRPDPTGTWRWTFAYQGYRYENTLRLQLEGEQVKGVWIRGEREASLEDGRYQQGELSFTVKRRGLGGGYGTYKFVGRVEGDKLRGKIEFFLNDQERSRVIDWEATRVQE